MDPGLRERPCAHLAADAGGDRRSQLRYGGGGGPTGARTTIAGQAVRALPAVELRRGIGYVIQQVGLFPHLTVSENVAIVPRLLRWSEPRVGERVEELLELVGLDPGVYRGRAPAAPAGGGRPRARGARAR